jgi:hypothetical protein
MKDREMGGTCTRVGVTRNACRIPAGKLKVCAHMEHLGVQLWADIRTVLRNIQFEDADLIQLAQNRVQLCSPMNAQ